MYKSDEALQGRDCDYSLCVACSAQSTTRERPAEVPDKRQLHATAEPSPPEAPVEPVTDEPAHNTNAAATTDAWIQTARDRPANSVDG